MGEERGLRSAGAVEAARVLGLELGLDVRDPVILHDAFSVVVHLQPAPVVARVPLVLPPGMQRAALAERQQREVDFVGWLAGTGLPVVGPSPLVPARPHVRDSYSMTFWELADLAEDHVPYGSADAALVVELHAAMRKYPGTDDLPFMSPVNMSVPGLLEALQSAPELIGPADLERALAEWAMLAPIFASEGVFRAAFPEATIQAVHGDVPSYNIIRTKSGIRFADFEDVSCAPLEWDLALGTDADIEGYNAEATRKGMPIIDAGVLKVMNAGRMLQTVGSLALIPQLPLLEEGLKPAIEAWRTMPFAGGLEG